MEEVKQKRGRKANPNSVSKVYFGPKEEAAIEKYLTTATEKEKNEIFREIIDPGLRALIKGVRKMPMFQKIIGITEEALEEGAYFHLICNLEKYKPGTLGKDDKPTRAYSYYGTTIKNYILGLKQEADRRINEHGGMVDIDTMFEQVVDTSSENKPFEEVQKSILGEIEKVLTEKKINKNDIIVANTLKYMITNWHKLEFQTKNEFVRLLCHYTQLKPTVVARSLKKFKVLLKGVLS